MSKGWYVVHTYSGFEGRVKTSIEERAKTPPFRDRIGQVLVPTERVIEIREGKKRESVKKFFPGYVFVEMEMDEDLCQVIRNTPKVTGFLGGSVQPAPLSEKEVEVLLKQLETGTAQVRRRTQFGVGDAARIIDGPFLGFNGVIDEVNPDHNKVKVLVSIFGRATPVELDFLQVERL